MRSIKGVENKSFKELRIQLECHGDETIGIVTVGSSMTETGHPEKASRRPEMEDKIQGK